MNFKNLATTIGVLILLAAVPVAVYLSTRKEPLGTEIRAGREKVAVFYLWPAEIHLSPGEETEVRIILSTQDKETSGATVKLKYDPAVLDILTVENGIIFNKYTDKKIDTKKGEIRIQAQGNFTGTATFALLTFKPKKAGDSQLNLFAGDCEVKDSEGADILQGVNGTILIIK